MMRAAFVSFFRELKNNSYNSCRNIAAGTPSQPRSAPDCRLNLPSFFFFDGGSKSHRGIIIHVYTLCSCLYKTSNKKNPLLFFRHSFLENKICFYSAVNEYLLIINYSYCINLVSVQWKKSRDLLQVDSREALKR